MQIELTKYEGRLAEAALVMLWQARMNMKTLSVCLNNRLFSMAPADADINTPEGEALQAMVDSLNDWIARLSGIREEFSEAME